MKRKYIGYIVLFILIVSILYLVYKKYKGSIILYNELDKSHIEDKKYYINKINKNKDIKNSLLDSLDKKQKIPKVIHQTYINRDMDVEYYETCMINKNMNPEYEYKFYTDNDIRKYIKDNFPEYLKAYDKLIPGAYKADLFRYLVLYKEGGVYIDCKSSTISPLREFINPDIGFISFKDRVVGTIQISFIASIPEHPILKKSIELTINNIENERYGINMLDITGPQLCGRAFNILLKRPELEDIEEKIYKEIDAEIIGSFVTIGKNKYEVLCDRNLKPLISRTCGSYRDKKYTTNNYGVRWSTGTVYN